MKMSVDFNREVDRRSTSDVKWRPEGLKGYLPIEVSENEIPMWIADMDFACPECIVRAIKERADKEIFVQTLPTGLCGLHKIIIFASGGKSLDKRGTCPCR